MSHLWSRQIQRYVIMNTAIIYVQNIIKYNNLSDTSPRRGTSSGAREELQETFPKDPGAAPRVGEPLIHYPH